MRKYFKLVSENKRPMREAKNYRSNRRTVTEDNTGNIYVVDKLYKEATEYDYEEGEKGDFYANTINIKFKDDTIQGVIENISSFIGIDKKDIADNLFIREDGQCSFEILETEYAEKATRSEIEKWRDGKFVLWNAIYMFTIEVISHTASQKDILNVYPKADHEL